MAEFNENKDLKKGYYAIIPSNVRYDKNLCANAKLLYGEVTALCNEKGFCWAQNDYFAELYGVTNKSISKWVNQLLFNKYIEVNFRYLAGTSAIEARCISLPTYRTNVLDPMEQMFSYPRTNVLDPMEQKVIHNNTTNNTLIEVSKKDKSEAVSYDTIVNAYSENESLRSVIFEFIKNRMKLRKLPTNHALKLLLTRLDKLAKNDIEKIAILEYSIMQGYQGIFPLKDDNFFNYDNRTKPIVGGGTNKYSSSEIDALGKSIFKKGSNL